MRCVEGAGVTAAQSGERGWIVVGRLFGVLVCLGEVCLGEVGCGELRPGHEGSACSHGHAVEEVAARDAALHSQFTVAQLTVASVAQKASESSECSNRNIVLNVPTGTFCAYRFVRTIFRFQRARRAESAVCRRIRGLI